MPRERKEINKEKDATVQKYKLLYFYRTRTVAKDTGTEDLEARVDMVA